MPRDPTLEPSSMSPRRTQIATACLIATAGLATVLAAQEARTGAAPSGWRQHDVHRPAPPVVEPADTVIAATPPRDAVILFDGSGLDAWQSPGGGPAGWKATDGYLETVPGTGAIETRARFGDIQLHLEWASPSPPLGKGQDRGNSGVFLMGQFEIQVLDSYQAGTYADGMAGAIYGEYPPLANATRPPGQWQAYDIAFRRPRFDASGTLREPARITLFHNGILVQNNEEPFGPTSWLRWLPYQDTGDRGPLVLQDHGHRVRFRNIWVRELPERSAPSPQDLARPQVVELPEEVLDQYAGRYRMGEPPGASEVTITRKGGHLTVAFPFRPGALDLEPISETEFDMPFTAGRFRFRTDDEGHVAGALFRIGDSTRDLKRIGR